MSVGPQTWPAPSGIQLDRERFRRERARRAGVGAGASSVLLVVVLVGAVVLSPGWPRVRSSFFDLDVARDALPSILSGLLVNIEVLLVAAVLVVLIGLGIACLRTLRGPVFFPLRALANAYTDLFRGVPLIILLYIIGLGIPGLRLHGVTSKPVVLGATAIVLVYGAYVAEVFRAGIESVHPSQRAAARSLGLTYGQTLRHVVLPQAVRRVLPPLLNDFVALQKDVGLISVVGATDAIRAAQIEVADSFNYTPYVVAGLLFILLAVPTARVADRVQVRAIRRQQASGVA